MDRSISQAAVYEKSFSLACSKPDLDKETSYSIHDGKETRVTSTVSVRPDLRGSEGREDTLLFLKSPALQNDQVLANFTQPTMSSASRKPFDDHCEIDGVKISWESYWETAGNNWVYDSCMNDYAQKSAENNIQENMHEETVEVSDKEWNRMVWMYGPSDVKAEMLEKERNAFEGRSEDLQNAMRNSDFEGFLEKYPGTDPSIFVPV